MEQKLRVGASLGGGLDLVGVELARLPRFDDSGTTEEILVKLVLLVNRDVSWTVFEKY